MFWSQGSYNLVLSQPPNCRTQEGPAYTWFFNCHMFVRSDGLTDVRLLNLNRCSTHSLSNQVTKGQRDKGTKGQKIKGQMDNRTKGLRDKE